MNKLLKAIQTIRNKINNSKVGLKVNNSKVGIYIKDYLDETFA